jgi:SIR2-like domain
LSENTVVVKNYYDGDLRQAIAGSDRYIIKPHGTVDSMSKMIFTLEDYARARVEHAPFYDMMTALLHTHTFLCIGCGLSDPDMKIIFEDYRNTYSESPHFMTIPSPFHPAERALLQKTRGINVLTYSSKDNHVDLTTALVELGTQVSSKRDEIAELQSW